MPNTVTDNTDAGRFELDADGHTAFIDYRIRQSGADDAKTYVLVHTEVPSELGGRGVGTRLVEGALGLIRESGAKVRSECSFVTAYLARHPDFSDIVA